MEAKVCKKCGVVLCERNWIKQFVPKKQNHIDDDCKHCRYNCRYVLYTYSDKRFEDMSKLNARVISAHLTELKHNHRKKQGEMWKEQRDTLHISYITQLLKGKIDKELLDKNPQELIELKRKQIKAYRKWKTRKKELLKV